ncbi:MAG: hypothetical protein WC759_01800 [Candidatus Micrarchaeia archaeon]|jgi:hypothetical protein
MGRMRGQTTIEYLLLISVVVLLFVGVLVTVNSLRQEANKNVNVTGVEQTPTEAIGSQLEGLRNIATTPASSSAPSLHLSIVISDAVPCQMVPLTITVKNENGPVVGAQVTLRNATDIVDTKNTLADGGAVFVPQSVGTHTVVANATGSEAASKSFTIAC